MHVFKAENMPDNYAVVRGSPMYQRTLRYIYVMMFFFMGILESGLKWRHPVFIARCKHFLSFSYFKNFVLYKQ